MTRVEDPSQSVASTETALYRKIEEIRRRHHLADLAISWYDYETTLQWAFNADTWFHAASTMKLAVLLGVFREVHHGRLSLEDPLHVRNRFSSVIDGSPYMLSTNDSSDLVSSHIGRSLTIQQLAYEMITVSSNLATNLLVQLVGVSAIEEALREQHVSGVAVRRGVEDQKAFDEGLNNEVTANGLAQLLRVIAEERAYSPEACSSMLDIMYDQKFKSGIPAGLPSDARVAHKTGNISTVHHDAGIVFFENRKPYVLAVLTRFDADQGRGTAIADVSRDIHSLLGELGS